MIGTGEIIFLSAALLLLFGGKKIPELMRSLGQGVKSFKTGMNDDLAPMQGPENQPQDPAMIQHECMPHPEEEKKEEQPVENERQ